MALVKKIMQILSFTGSTVPVGYTPIKEGRAEVTIGADTVQVPLVVNVDEAGNALAPLTDAQLRASAIAVSGPLTDAQLRASPVPTTLASLPAFAATPTVNLGTIGGAATDATLVAIRNAIQAQISLASTLWTDNSGAFYVRKDSINQNTGVITVSFANPSGAAATPGAGLKPVDATDSEVISTVYDAAAPGTGYSAGDVLISVSIINTSASTPTAAFIWINQTTQAVLTAAPAKPDLIEHKQSVSIAGTVPVSMSTAPAGAATDAAIATLTASVNTLAKHIAVQNILASEALDRGATSLGTLITDPALLTYQ